MNNLENEFNNEVELLLQQTTKEISRPMYFYKLSNNLGTHLKATKKLIPKMSDGFIKLIELNKLHLSVESIVIKEKYKSLFTDKEVKSCKRKLGVK